MIIRTLRQKAGMTQRELAEACGLGQSAIGNYEAGFRKPSFGVVAKVVTVIRSRGVRVSIDDIFPGSAA